MSFLFLPFLLRGKDKKIKDFYNVVNKKVGCDICTYI